jgi:hypothetical protein
MKALTLSASVLYFAYSAMLVGVGAAGVVLARWELATIFAFDVTALGPVGSATMLNQYRFLKSVELGAGIYSLMLRRRILAGEREAAAFLALVAGGCFARIVAWIVDGQPTALFIGFLAAEILTFVVVGLHVALRGRP